MQRALVVVDDTDAHRELLERAGELAAGTDADNVCCSCLPVIATPGGGEHR